MNFAKFLRRKPQPPKEKKKISSDLLELEKYLESKDYNGAISLLLHKINSSPNDTDKLWLGHCLYRAGKFEEAYQHYINLEKTMEKDNYDPDINTYIGCCAFNMGLYDEAALYGEKGTKGSLQTRLLFHVSHRRHDQNKLLQYHKALSAEAMEDQMSLAAVHFNRQHFTDALNIYKSYVATNTNMLALNVYMAMCYYKMEYYEVAEKMVEMYLKVIPESPAALNLLASIKYKTSSGALALACIKDLLAARSTLYPSIQLVLRHNEVVFNEGENALTELPALTDVVHEAKLNLTLYFIKTNDFQRAYELCQPMEILYPNDYLIKAIAYTRLGYLQDKRELLNEARDYYQLVGENDIETDTIVGRECMASYHFLSDNYQETLIYLKSITKFNDSDVFHFNCGQALVMTGNYVQAEEEFRLITGEIRDTTVYRLMFIRVLAMNGKNHLAWDTWTRYKEHRSSYAMLQIIAGDSYTKGEYYYAAKAYDQLEQLDPGPDNWLGKVTSVTGVFRMLVMGKASNEQMNEVIRFLKNDNQPQTEYLLSTIRNWARRNAVNIEI